MLSDIENIDGHQINVRVFQWHVTLRLHWKRVRLSSTFFHLSCIVIVFYFNQRLIFQTIFFWIMVKQVCRIMCKKKHTEMMSVIQIDILSTHFFQITDRSSTYNYFIICVF